jgi:hypothetical protein
MLDVIENRSRPLHAQLMIIYGKSPGKSGKMLASCHP